MSTTAFTIQPFCSASGSGTYQLLQTATVSNGQAVLTGIDGSYESYYVYWYDVKYSGPAIQSPQMIAYFSSDNGATVISGTNNYFYYGRSTTGGGITPSAYTIVGIPGDAFIPTDPRGDTIESFGRMHIVGAADPIETRYYIQSGGIEAVIQFPGGLTSTNTMRAYMIPGHLNVPTIVNSVVLTGYSATLTGGTFELYGY